MPGKDKFQGLTNAASAEMLAREGFNELPSAGRRTSLRIVIDVLREPMLALLIGGGLVYLALGDVNDAAILMAFACLSVLITVVQESRTERVLETLRDLTSPRALVIRDGERVRIPGREVVRGDLILLGEGDRVPADAQIVEGSDLQADESLLTGESVPVRKSAGRKLLQESLRPGGDDLPIVYSGTLIVRGSGVAKVVATGGLSEIGKIGKALGRLDLETPILQIKTRRLVTIFASVGAVVSLLVVLLYGLYRGGWLDAVLAGIAVGMSMLPEEFPVVLTVFMAMGAWRISQVRVLTRRATAIESLGSATVLCTDKTGTLTENRMTIAELRLANGDVFEVSKASVPMPVSFQNLLTYGVLASAIDPFDPMEKAFHVLAQRSLTARSLSDPGRKLVKTYPLRTSLLAMSQVWQGSRSGKKYVVATKGAPEAIAGLCRMSAKGRTALDASVNSMAEAGLRVLGVAQASFTGAELPANQREFKFKFLGLVGLLDPLRKSVPAAVAECDASGIRVIMITGDYPATARAIAQQAGIAGGDLITGDELAKLDEDELARRARTATVFARIMPEQKLRIVEALKRDGEIVAMTGDGVNDAPSLKAAHIGVAMGGRGTDVAREASSIVLLEDDFGSIVTTIRLGRRIFDNLRKAMSFIVAVHVPIAGLAVLPLIAGLPILFGPVHIAFLEMIIDPVCSLVFEAETEEDDVMRRPPRDPQEPLFSVQMILWSVLQGSAVFALAAAVYLLALRQNIPVTEVRALTFFALVTSIIALVLVNRSTSASLIKAIGRPNRALRLILPMVAAILALTLLWPTAAELFRFGPLHANDLALTFGAGLSILILLEFLKPLLHKNRQMAPAR
jgi:P-type Ca2+ transporter type 2C